MATSWHVKRLNHRIGGNEASSCMKGCPETLIRQLSIVIPAYNEEARIAKTIESIRAFVARTPYDLEVIVVDDGSTDGTPALLNDYAKRLPFVRTIRYESNRGKDVAVKTGIAAATRSTTLFTDADLPCPLDDLKRLWPWYDRGFQVVIGSRRSSGAHVEVPHPRMKRIASFVFSVLTRLLVIRGFLDTQCGFKLLNTEAARAIVAAIKTKGFSFDVELLVRARQFGFRIKEVGVRWSAVPGSRMGLLKHGPKMILQLLELRRLG